MANLEKLGKGWDRQQRKPYLRLQESVRSELSWRDAIVGFCAAIVLSAILVGFRHQRIPEFKVNQIANQDVRVAKDAQYIDTEETKIKRAEAAAKVRSVYHLDQNIISERKKIISRVFSDSRNLLSENNLTSQKGINSDIELDLANELKIRLGDTFPAELLPILLRERFNIALENRILDALGTVLQEGIIEDAEQLENEQGIGFVIQESSFPFHIRDLSEAKEYLRQFDLGLQQSTEEEKDILFHYLETMLVPTLVYDAEETEKNRDIASSQVPNVEVKIKRGQMLVQQGDIITADLLRKLDILRDMWKPSSTFLQGMGYFLFISILLYSLWRYLVYFQSQHQKIRKHATLIIVIITSELLIIRFATVLADILDERFHRFQDPATLYFATPFALGPLLVTLLTDTKLGIITSVFLATVSGLFYGNIDAAVYLIMGSLVGIYGIRQYKDRVSILKVGFAIGILNCICLAGLNILQQNPVSLSAGIDLVAVAFLSGLLASTIASMMLPALEFFFKIVTDIRLLELSNLNAPILRRLSVEAPGTYHHSLMVATLAEFSAESIGANALLTRVSAYYHDIGKILKPEYFVENQSLEYNKHEQISPRISSIVLSRHVKDGLKLAKEIGLPQIIRDMIPQHHGTRIMSYFFRKAKETADYKNGKVSDADFRYSGPKPQSKEAAIMMMADSVEAASRTLSDPNPSQIQGMIDRLVNGIVEDNQFDECDITLRDVRLVKESFFKILTGIFHRRIDYPDYDFKSAYPKTDGTADTNPDSKQTKTI
jgi:putative nucleotidyltransferase with HDIG domain